MYSILALFLSLSTIIIVYRFFKNLHVGLLVGIVLLAFLSRQTFESSLYIVLQAATAPDNIMLVFIVCLVIFFSNQMKKARVLDSLVTSVRSRFADKTAIAVLPALIGLLPMPGGALFSAPMVDSCDEDGMLEPVSKTTINYWFRHVWEYWWPIYPGVLLAIEISKLPVVHFVFMQLIFSFFSILAGYIFFLRKFQSNNNNRYHYAGLWNLLRNILPVMIVILIYSLIRGIFPSIISVNKYIPMVLGIVCGAMVLQILFPVKKKQWKEILTDSRAYLVALLILFVRIFGAFIEAPLPEGQYFMHAVQEELSSLGIPMILLICALPFISGLTTGIAVGFVGTSFPVVTSLIAEKYVGFSAYPYISLAFVFGYLGMMLSPIHVCLIVTNEHFKSNLMYSLKNLLLPVLFVGSCSFLYFYFLLWLF